MTDSLYIAQSNEANLNVNSTTWWAGLTNWLSGWFVNNAGTLEFNETKLNNTISSEGVRLGFNSTYNSTYATWAYNQTIPANSYTDTKVGTADLHLHNAANITSPLWVNKTGDTMAGNLNMSTNNVTSVDCIVFSSGGKICSA